jgi:CxxC motif-containing protein (DUF1111 family)
MRDTRRFVTVVGVLVILVATAIAASSQSSSVFGRPFSNLTPDQLELFKAGIEDFQEVEEVEDGLGPVFNEASCATCHSEPTVGGGSARLETRFGRLKDGSFDPMVKFGGSLLQDNGIGKVGRYKYDGERVPPEATIVAQRRTTPLFGLGLVDAVPGGTFLALADMQNKDPATRNTAGRPNMVIQLGPNGEPGPLVVGKFGWKAQVPTLFQFSGDAYLNEMGITNPMFPNENCPEGDCSTLAGNPAPDRNDDGAGVTNFANFMTLLAPPPRGPITADVTAGEAIFKSIGCANCHVPALTTGDDHPVAALKGQTFFPFSDFLLHDMGSLGDGIVQGVATGREMRTAPLWGLREIKRFLHDGRATTVDKAILEHDGQGAPARDAFDALSPDSRQKLRRFLDSL